MKIIEALSRVWLTADQHFGHANIIDYCKRPFADADEMDGALVSAWNEVVEANDIVLHLADFTLSNRSVAQAYLKQLNGRINLLCYPWHHDKRWLPHPDTIMMARRHCVTWSHPLVVLEVPELGSGGHPLAITLCHYPLAIWDRKHYGAIHCHGHSHGDYEGEGRIIDVGVDSAANLVGAYRPLSLAEVIEVIDEK